MKRPFTILCIPGIGHPELEDRWFEVWEREIREFLETDGYNLDLNLVPFRYRRSFRSEPIEAARYADALADLGFGSGTGASGKIFRNGGGMDPLAEALKWRAATIVHWASNMRLRQQLVEDLKELMIEHQPDLILAHSLGSLIAYDCLLQLSKPFLENRALMIFGSQLGNPYVRNLYAGRISELPLQHWYYLYNKNDSVFTSPVHLQDSNYALVNVTFDNEDPLDHTAISTGKGSVGYLDHFTTRQLVWPNVIRPPERSVFLRSVRRSFRGHQNFDTADHRALLIGIDDYEHSSIPGLGGCVTDTYLMSETLQAAGFPADNIRLLHNSRATRDNIMDRLDWLLDDIEAGDVPEFRFLHFSGHGAQMASYGVAETIDRLDECLCPYDFDWSLEKAILDDLFCSIYAQLPYDAHLVVVLDCCHSGGMARNGNSIRGLSGPRDVAHRELTYTPPNEETPHGIWQRRSHALKVNREFFRKGDEDKTSLQELWLGRDGTVRKLGRSASLRQMSAEEFDRRRGELKHYGPYLPTIFEACQEAEPALEHVQGSTTYGAFTFAFGQALQSLLREGTTLAYDRILQRTEATIKDLGYSQQPQLLMPRNRSRLTVPRFTSTS